MKNRNVIIGAVIAVVIVAAGAYFFLNGSSSRQSETTAAPEIQETVIPTINPLDLGLTFSLRSDKKAAKFEITNVKDIQNVEYQLSYTKEINGEQVPEGLIGEAKPRTGESIIAIAYREFGTCSSGTCRYDKVVSSVKLTLKITKIDGKIYQAEKTVDL